MLLYTPQYRIAEEETAYLINQFISQSPDKLKPVYGNALDNQRSAIDHAATKQIMILRGYPGSGKTTTIRNIVTTFQEAGMRGKLLAPTGKAAKRAKDVLFADDNNLKKINENYIDISTIHRCIGYKKSDGNNEVLFHFDEDNKIDADYVIIDEASMSGLLISHGLLKAIDPRKTRLVICGDSNQLQSIDAGNFFNDLIDSKIIPDVNLKKIYRQGQDSGIVNNAFYAMEHGIYSGSNTVTRQRFTDIEFIETKSHARAVNLIVDYCTKARLSTEGKKFSSVQCIAPGKKGDVGTVVLNDAIRNVYRDQLANVSKKRFRNFMLYDKVINKKNRYDLNIVNGDTGVVTEVNNDSMVVDFGKGCGQNEDGIVVIDSDTANSIYHAYAYTIHSSQGSEYECVILPLFKTHYMLLSLNLYYTAITRAKKHLVVVFEQEAIKRCLSNKSLMHRNSNMVMYLHKYNRNVK
jgi:exodeoxyribonuclease V alpha subunit